MRVLLTGPTTAAEPPIRDLLRNAVPHADVVADPLSPDVLRKLALGDFAGVVCRADGPEAIELISRIRSQNPDVPVVLLSRETDPEFESAALCSGASSVLSSKAGAGAIAENVRRMVALKREMRAFQENAQKNERLRVELRDAVLHRRAISQYGGHVNRNRLRRGLLPLLVQNDPEAAFLMVKALEKAEVFAPLPILKSAEEAIAYLQGAPPYSNRHLHPLPNAILLDLCPTLLGIDLLRWIRREKSLAGIPVIVLSGTGHPEEIREAYSHLASSFLIKPPVFEDLVALVRSVDVYWTRINIGGTS